MAFLAMNMTVRRLAVPTLRHVGSFSSSSMNRVATMPLVQSRHYSIQAEATPNIKKVGVAGFGLMGSGIAQVSASAGFEVVALETKQEFIDAGLKRVSNSISLLAKKQVKKGNVSEDEATALAEQAIARIQGTTNREDLADCDLVIEAIIENMDVKEELYGALGKICKPGCIFASNTSSLSIAEMGEFTKRPNQMVGLHAFNPVPLMALMEVVRTEKTASEVFDAAFQFAKDIGKVPVKCKDTPGFVVNRLLVPSLAQAVAMLERGDASVTDIDTAMRLGAGHPMGPLTLADYVGLDTTLYILEGWTSKYPDEPAFFIPPVLRNKVAAGNFGRKSGRGFYIWDGDKPVGVADD